MIGKLKFPDDDKEHEDRDALIHARCMDWDAEFLKPLTIEVDFRKEGTTLFIGTTWVGYVGMLTGMKPGAFSVSINFRALGGSILKNVWEGVKSSWPIGFLVREALENSSINSYDNVVSVLSESSLMAPCYITICGLKGFEGIVLTRNREGVESPLNLEDPLANVVQTNIDHWSDSAEQDILYSVARRTLAYQCLRDAGAQSPEDMEQILGKYPILNEETIYQTIMCPATRFYKTKKIL
eukprot:TRINITY_DN6863_c0_g1_i3.p2 TRINITY_DN6863_c0_g1~~TRINITY_DN6863_c0_g1_i3.p2  ORF type:complete len:239 (+),score=58.19 TRINITY_DN6863_c0_g1_i3:739-1455(+)